MLESDGIDDVTVLVNSSPGKILGLNISYASGFPSMSNGVLCAKASMLLQVRTLDVLHTWPMPARKLRFPVTLKLLVFYHVEC